MRRRLCIVTGSRAEWGHLRWLALDIASDPTLELQLLVCGSHLSAAFGLTYREIEADGHRIDEKIDCPVDGDTPGHVLRSLACTVSAMASALERLRPDILVILGDRLEMLAAAQAALVLHIPVAHLHGGESSEGAYDESIRHAITKMAHIHFVATAVYRQRVIQLGENPRSVHDVGAPGLDALARETMLDRRGLAEALGHSLGGSIFLVTYHPVTLSGADSGTAATAVVTALESFADATVIVTGVNADTGHKKVREVFQAYARRHPERVILAESLGSRRYLSTLRLAQVVIGNSSSGIIEAPAVGTPTVNVGDRQRGRLRAASIIDCAEDPLVIRAAIACALSPTFRSGLSGMKPPYGSAGASNRIKETLRAVPLAEIMMKRFHDLPVAAA